MASAYIPAFPQKPSTKNGITRPAILFLAWCAAGSRLLFFDGTHIASAVNLSAAPGVPRHMNTWADPHSFVGWGYPSVWGCRLGDGSAGFRMAYNGDYGHNHLPRIILLAESADGVNWAAASTAAVQLNPRLADNELMAGGPESN